LDRNIFSAIHRGERVRESKDSEVGGEQRFWKTWCTDKKEKENFLIYKEIQVGSVAKSYSI
jgi:hypothetical protein